MASPGVSTCVLSLAAAVVDGTVDGPQGCVGEGGLCFALVVRLCVCHLLPCTQLPSPCQPIFFAAPILAAKQLHAFFLGTTTGRVTCTRVNLSICVCCASIHPMRNVERFQHTLRYGAVPVQNTLTAILFATCWPRGR